MGFFGNIIITVNFRRIFLYGESCDTISDPLFVFLRLRNQSYRKEHVPKGVYLKKGVYIPSVFCE